jgi:hypothetical protein
MSALTGLAEECDKTTTAGVAGGVHTLLWKSFVLVKLPSLIEKLELKKFNKFEEHKVYYTHYQLLLIITCNLLKIVNNIILFLKNLNFVV